MKDEHKRLNEIEPFNIKEIKQFNAKDRSMIRNIQVLNNFSKKEAIETIKSYKGSPKANLKRLAKDYRERMKKYYPQTTPEIRGTIPTSRKKMSKRTKKVFEENRKKINEYIKNPRNKSQKGYKRIVKASKKYLDASRYELHEGVNSKKSQAYRERIGLSARYEGRIVGTSKKKVKK
jgi:hypothetical protein